MFATSHLCRSVSPYVMNLTSIAAKLKSESMKRRVQNRMRSAGENFSKSRYMTEARPLTRLSSSFCNSCRLFEEVRHRGLADRQVIRSVRLRGKKRDRGININTHETPESVNTWDFAECINIIVTKILTSWFWPYIRYCFVHCTWDSV